MAANNHHQRMFITEGNPAFSPRLMICGFQSNKDEHLQEECRILHKRKIGCHAFAHFI